LHAVERGSGSAEIGHGLERVVLLEGILADTTPTLAVVTAIEAVVGAAAAEPRRPANRRIATFDALRFASAIPEAFVDEVV
jgi:hypothetical protein